MTYSRITQKFNRGYEPNLTPQWVAAVLGGDINGRDSVLVPGPGHSRADRSLSIKIDSGAPGGFVVYSHAGDDPIECRDYVSAALGLGRPVAGSRPITRPSADIRICRTFTAVVGNSTCDGNAG